MREGEQGIVRVDDGTTHKIGVIFAENQLSCVLIHVIVLVEVAEKGGAEQRGDIGIVHYVFYSKSDKNLEMR